MRILVIGATGTIGRAVVAALQSRHEIVLASLHRAPETVDLADAESIDALFRRVGRVDAVISAAGQAKFAPLPQLSDDDFGLSLGNKLMGQVNLVRLAQDSVADGGSFTLTSGVLAQQPIPGSAAISLVNAGLEGFVRAAALELPRGLRVNIVSPPWVAETLTAMGRDPSAGRPAADVARAYVASVEGRQTGAVLSP
ncbi:MAG: short chain dehydrogenase [Gemmatimonadota bacterium]|nr:short chain dehydrogenase [Gemmatimonadota bacterium]